MNLKVVHFRLRRSCSLPLDPTDFESSFLTSMDVPLIVAGVQRQNEPSPGESPVTAWAHTDSYLMSEMALDHLSERGSTRPAVLFGEVPMALMDDLRDRCRALVWQGRS